MAENKIAVHSSPVWREQANFIIRAPIKDGADAPRFEQLWARQISERRFALCCIPFFLYDVALGDEVVTNDDYVFERVVRPSGGYTFRAWFGDSNAASVREDVVQRLEEISSTFEWYSDNLLAVDARDETKAQRVADFLQRLETEGLLKYETGRTS